LTWGRPSPRLRRQKIQEEALKVRQVVSMLARSTVIFLILAGLARPAAAAPSVENTAKKTIKTLVNAIRYKKDDLAAKQLGFQTMAASIMGEHWQKTSTSDRKELTTGLEKLVRKITFAKGREMFEYLDAILYDNVRMADDRAICKTTIVVHHKLKKKEVVIEFVLAQEAGGWKVVDTILLGESTAEGIYEDQIEPLVDEGGIPAVMTALRKKLAELGL